MAQGGQQLAHGPLPLLQAYYLPLQEQFMLSVFAQANESLAFHHAALSGSSQVPFFRSTSDSTIKPLCQQNPTSSTILQFAENTLPLAHLMLPQIPPVPALAGGDLPVALPVYNGVNLSYPGLHLINAIPPIYV